MAKEQGAADDKEKVMAWKSMTSSEILEYASRFVHLTSKVNTTAVRAVGIRLPVDQAKEELPYIGLTTVGAPFEALDFCDGGAASVPKSRQIKDHITGKFSGVKYDKSAMTSEEISVLSKDGAAQAILSVGAAQNIDELHPLLRQVLVPDTISDQFVSLTPLGGVGLSQMFLDELDKEQSARFSALVKTITDPKKKKRAFLRPFWQSVVTAIGGDKPQNISLLCAVAGGGRRAKFAFWFGGPAIANTRSAVNFTALHRGLQIWLNPTDRAEMADALIAWDKKVNMRTSNAMQWSLEKQVRLIKARARMTYAEMAQAFLAELKQKELPERFEINPLLDFWNLPEQEQVASGLGRWAIKTRNEIQQGWLKQTFTNNAWAQKAAKQLVNTWTNQIGMALSQHQQQTLTKIIVAEIQK